MRKLISWILVLTLMSGLISGCSNNQEKNNQYTNDSETKNNDDYFNNVSNLLDVNFAKTDEEMFTTRDKNTDYDNENVVTIILNDTSSTSSSDSVKIVDSMVTITEEATYLISGNLSNGMLIINAKDTAKIHLIFDEVNINNKSSAALYILEADKVFITLTNGSSNFLSNGGDFISIDDNNIDGALFSKQDLTLNGSGSLTISSPVGHGIVCKDDLVITNGNYIINSASHGLDVNDSVRIANATINIDAELII